MMLRMMTRKTNHKERIFFNVLICLLSCVLIGYGCAPAASKPQEPSQTDTVSQPVTGTQPVTATQPVAFAQSEIPAFITSRFGAIYPGATDVVWTSKDRSYEVAFHFKQTEFKVLFLEDGSVERTKTKAEISTLPEGITKYAEGRNIKEAMHVIDGFGTVTWEVKIGEVKYLFTQKGELLGQLP